MQATYFERHPFLKDILGIIVFIICVTAGTIFINTFVFRSFNVEGPSMETTLFTGDRLIVSRLPVTWAQLQNKSYIPERGDIIVFKNPRFVAGMGEEYIVKRVIAFEGERVRIINGHFMVYNSEHPKGFNPDDANNGEPGSPTSGEYDDIVPEGTIFVSGDHRQDNYSYDSRNGLGTVPYYDIIGPVSIRIFPFTSMRFF
jgi:signal peptidase I